MNQEMLDSANADYQKLEEIVILYEQAYTYHFKYPSHDELKKIVDNLAKSVEIFEEIFRKKYSDLIDEGVVFSACESINP
jgi:hypothetical protein